MLRQNNRAFVTKVLRKTIKKQSKLKNLFNKQRTHENWVSYKMQWNHCANLLKKNKANYFTNLITKDLNDGKNSGKKLKRFQF